MNKSNNIWNRFAEKHPSASKWIREGGLFVIVSNLITVLKYVMLLFLPLAFAGLPNIDFGFPGIDITLFGETFKWNIIGYDAAHGGLPYFCAYMIAMLIGECINFPIQRSFVFRSKGKIWYQAFWYLIAFCIVTCIVNSINFANGVMALALYGFKVGGDGLLPAIVKHLICRIGIYERYISQTM